MTGQAIAEKVRKLIAPVAVAQQFELVDVEFKHEGQVYYLRIFIDKPGGLTIHDCQRMSRECEVILDVEDIIHKQYVLEVSSPGLDRPLKTIEDYTRFQSRLVKIKTFQAMQGRKNFLGHLQDVVSEKEGLPPIITVCLLDGEQVHISFNLIASARLEVEL